ncbi:MAG: hypothetical protein IK077_08865 [Thermoguttaceae bacterium]|nr:hypothetical protein [Thermoguttaceae bacterium]
MTNARNSTGTWTFVGKGALWAFFAVVACWQARSFSEYIVDSAFESDSSWNGRSETELLFDASVEKLESLNSLSADVEFESSCFGVKYFGRGKYKELSLGRARGASRRTPFETKRFLLNATLSSSDVEEATQSSGPDDNFLTIVCDCEALSWWRYSSVEGEKSLERINIEELWNRFGQLDDEELETLRANGVSDLNCGLNALPGLGGLLGLLRRARANYEFEPTPEAVETRQGDKLFKVVGKARTIFWEEARRSIGLLELEPAELEYMPSNVEIYFDAKWAFPCKFSFYSLVENGGKSVRNDVFTVSYLPNTERVSPEDFKYAQPQSTYRHAEIDYLTELIPGARF